MTIETLAKSTIDSAKGIDLITLAGQYTKLSRASGTKEMMGPCPRCGGDDRFHVKTAGFFCRQCKRMEDNHDIWYDQIDFVRWMDNCDFVTAVEKLTGTRPMTTAKQLVAPTTKSVKPADHSHYTGWLEKATNIARAAHDTLLMDGDGAEYLESRGITSNTWLAFKLGFAPAVPLPGTWDGKQHVQPRQPAIVIPWYRGGKITGIRYRFLTTHEYTNLEGKEVKVKTTSLHESDFTGVLYGGQALMGCAEQARTLVLCEGELNSISIWQIAAPWNFDVLSLGSESAKLTPAMIDYANKFERVIIWMDKADLVKQLMTSIGGSFGVDSLVIDNRKHDANAMLQTGQLGGFIASLRYQACQSNTERLRLLWNIQDAIRAGHMDIGACEVAVQIGKELNVSF